MTTNWNTLFINSAWSATWPPLTLHWDYREKSWHHTCTYKPCLWKRETISFLVVANMQVKEITGDQQIRAENKIMRKSFRACGRSVLSRLKNGLIAEGCSPHPALKWRCRRRRLIFPTNHSLERIRSPPGESGGNYRGKHLTWGTPSS